MFLPGRTARRGALVLVAAGAAAAAFGAIAARGGGRTAELTAFSFLARLDECRAAAPSGTPAGPALAAHAAAFGKDWRLQNRRRAAAGPLAPLARQVGIPVSQERRQVESRAALLLPPGLGLESPVLDLPSGARLRFATATVGVSTAGAAAVSGDGSAAGPTANTASFVVEVVAADGAVLLRRAFAQGAGAGWTERELSLAGLGTRAARVRLSAGGAPAGSYTLVADPRVAGPGRFAHPNVLVVLVDAVRRDAVGAHGSRLGATPHLDRWARSGAVFDQCAANANWTRPSELSMFTGRWPRDLRINLLDYPVGEAELEHFHRVARVETLPAFFRARGYAARGIVNNIFLQEFTGTGVDVGFDHLTDFRTPVRDTADITDEALAWVEANRDRPWFLFLNYNTPHKPYEAPRRFYDRLADDPAWRFEDIVKQYLAEVAAADDACGRLLDGLESRGLLADTITVFCSDHGEVMWPWHNRSTSWSDYTRFGHSLTMLDEELMVPFVIRAPGRVAPARITNQVQLVDLFPTLAELAGFPLPDAVDRVQRGASLVPLMAGRAPAAAERPVYAQGFLLEGLRLPGWKYAWRPPGFDKVGAMGGPPTAREPEELFDLVRDPQERTNLAADPAARAALERMRTLFAGVRDGRIPGTLAVTRRAAAERVDVTLATEGVFFRHEAPAGVAAVLSADGKRLVLSFGPGAPLAASVGFQLHPDYAPLAVSAARDGSLLPASAIGVGPAAAAALDAAGRLATRAQFRAARAAAVPFPCAAGEPGLYLWREPDEAVAWSRDTSALSTEIRHVLRDWGYVQK